MLIRSFTVQSGGKAYFFVDRKAIDSEASKRAIDKMHASSLNTTQDGVLCVARGLPDRGEIDSIVMGIYLQGSIVGIWMLGSISYVSGPWSDVSSWAKTDPNAAIVIDAIPMPGALSLSVQDEAALAADGMDALLNGQIMSGQNRSVRFARLHYAIFLDRSGAVDNRARAQHAAIKAHPGLGVSESPHPTIPGMTLVEVRSP